MQKKSFVLRVLSLFICALLLVMPVMTVQAQAVVTEGIAASYAISCVSSILIGAGLQFATSEEAHKVAGEFLENMATNAKKHYDKIIAMAAARVACPQSGAAFRLSQDLFDVILNSAKSFFNWDSAGDSVVSYTPSFDYSVVVNADNLSSINAVLASNVIDKLYVTEAGASAWYLKFWISTSAYTSSAYIFANYASQNNLLGMAAISKSITLADYSTFPSGRCYQLVQSGTNFYFTFGELSYENIMFSSGYMLSFDATPISVSGDLTYPADALVKAPDLPTVAEDGAITNPTLDLTQAGNLVPAADLPYDITAVPTDTLVDVTTGTAVDTNIGTGEGTATDTGSIAGQLSNFFDSPKDFSLNFDAFKNLILTDRFPFCIPFDFVDSIKAFSAAAADYNLNIDLITQFFEIHHSVDMQPFALPIAFFRYGATVWFTIALIFKTREMIKW